MRSNNDEFLNLYREYESLLRTHSKDYKDIEECSPEQIQGRLRIGRQIRNYLTHGNDPKYIEVSDVMLNFYQSQIDGEKLEEDLIKNYTKSKTVSMVTVKDKCGDALEKMRKLKIPYIFVYEDNDILGYVTIYDVINSYMSTKTSKIGDVKLNKKFSYCNSLDKASDYKESSCLVAIDNKGKVLGTVIL